MTYGALRLSPKRLRRPLPLSGWLRRPVRYAGALSVAGLTGVPVYGPAASQEGRLADVVVRWACCSEHPPVVGVIVRAGHIRHFVAMDAVAHLDQHRVQLTGPLPASRSQRQPGLVALVNNVLDRQLVDTDGVDVRRVSDLVLAEHPDGIRLVGVDVSVRTVLRRLGTTRMRRAGAPNRIYDWSAVVAFGGHPPGEAGARKREGDVVRMLVDNLSLHSGGSSQSQLTRTKASTIRSRPARHWCPRARRPGPPRRSSG